MSVTSDLSLSTGPKTSSVSDVLSSHHSCTHREVNFEADTSSEGDGRFLHTSQDVLKPEGPGQSRPWVDVGLGPEVTISSGCSLEHCGEKLISFPGIAAWTFRLIWSGVSDQLTD